MALGFFKVRQKSQAQPASPSEHGLYCLFGCVVHVKAVNQSARTNPEDRLSHASQSGTRRFNSRASMSESTNDDRHMAGSEKKIAGVRAG